MQIEKSDRSRDSAPHPTQSIVLSISAHSLIALQRQ